MTAINRVTTITAAQQETIDDLLTGSARRVLTATDGACVVIDWGRQEIWEIAQDGRFTEVHGKAQA